MKFILWNVGMMTWILVNFGSRYGLLHDATKPLPSTSIALPWIEIWETNTFGEILCTIFAISPIEIHKIWK